MSLLKPEITGMRARRAARPHGPGVARSFASSPRSVRTRREVVLPLARGRHTAASPFRLTRPADRS